MRALGKLAAVSIALAVVCGCDSRPHEPGRAASARDTVDAGYDAGHSSAGDTTIDAGSSGEGGSSADGGTQPGSSGDGQADAGGPDAFEPPPFGDAGPPALVCDGPGARFATGVVAHHFGPGQSFGQDRFPAAVLGPPKGGGACQASLDVVSLGNGGFVVLEFAGNAIVDGPGPDFIVFENPFYIGCDPSSVFAELGTVAVSEDGRTWTSFPCTATAAPYGLCSGWHPVLANADTNTIDPTDPSVAGGDPFDLADVGVKRARYVRITDRPDLVGDNGVYDLDAVSIVHPECP
jgi:hypothetical protein